LPYLELKKKAEKAASSWEKQNFVHQSTARSKESGNCQFLTHYFYSLRLHFVAKRKAEAIEGNVASTGGRSCSDAAVKERGNFFVAHRS
jgi:hypothetical protein